MAPLSRQALELHEPLSRWDHLVETLLVSLLAFAPFAFGGGTAWAAEVVLILAAAMALCLCGKLIFVRGTRFVRTWAYLPVVLFVALVWVQTLALPAAVVERISPATVRTKTELLAGLPGGPAVLRQLSLSFYALATSQSLRMVLAVAAVFVVVVNVYRRSMQIKRLLLAVALIGLAVAAMAAYQNITGARDVYGITGAVAHPNSGPFFNHSHFGQFMNLSIGAMLALLLVRVRETREGESGFGIVWGLGLGIVVSAGMIALSLTRGGVIALIISGALTGIYLALRWGARPAATALVMVSIAVAMCVLLAAFGSVFNRLATLGHGSVDDGTRVRILKDLSVVWRQFPVAGTGLGTHPFVFPMFDSSNLLAHATHAENEYAELMEETGGVGLGLCAIFLATIAAAYVRATGGTRMPVYAAGFGLGYGLLAILIHSGSDFGQHLPANACLTAVFAALLVCLARLRAADHGKSGAARRAPAWSILPFHAAATALVIAAAAWSISAADLDRRTQALWADATQRRNVLDKQGWDRATASEYAGLLRAASSAVAANPGDVVKVYWLDVYRWRAMTRAGNQLFMTPVTIDSTQRIVDELQQTRPQCPTFGPAVALAGELEQFVLDQPRGARDIRLGYRLDSRYPTTCLAAAQLDATAGRWTQAVDEARRTVSLDGSLTRQSLQLFVAAHRPGLAHQVVAGDRDGLLLLAELLSTGNGESSAVASQCKAEARELLRVRAADRDAPAGVLAEMAEAYASEGNDDAAIRGYEKALAREYGRAEWHMRLAELLGRTGKYDDAEREARVCLQLRPQTEAAQTLITALAAREHADR